MRTIFSGILFSSLLSSLFLGRRFRSRPMLAGLYAGFVLMVSASAAQAHDSRPLHVVIHETELGVYQIRLFIPPTVDLDNQPELKLACQREPTSNRMAPIYVCGDAPLAFDIKYPMANPGLTSVVEFHSLAGVRHISVLGPAEQAWRNLEERAVWGQLWRYAQTGVVHVLSGYDHILFLILLVFIAHRRLIAVITGFTLSHSISLAASALDWVRVSALAIEILIAMSIVFLAAEILRPRRDSWGWRYPFLVTLGFGFIHGFGFANNLNEIGLPSNSQIIALAAFNVGVEVGQIIIVLPVAFLVAAVRRYDAQMADRRLAHGAAWSMGLMASFWMWQRASTIIFA